MITKYRFIHFEETKTLYGDGYTVKNNKMKSVLGEITFYPEWDNYVFQASPKAIFSAGCLKDIIDFIRQLKKGIPK